MLGWKHLALLAFPLVLSGCFANRPNVSEMKKVCPAGAKASVAEATYSDVPWQISPMHGVENSLYRMLTKDDSLPNSYRAGWTTSIEHLAGPGKRYRVCLRDSFQQVVRSCEIDLIFDEGYFWARRHFDFDILSVFAAIGEHIITFGIGPEGQICVVRSTGGMVLFGIFPLSVWMTDWPAVYPRVSSTVAQQMTHEVVVDLRQVVLTGTSGINRNADTRAKQRDAYRR